MKNIIVLSSAFILWTALAGSVSAATKPAAGARSKVAAKPQAGARSNMVLVQNGKSSYVIAVAADAIAAEKTAARQLQEYLQQVTGARLEIKPESAVAPKAAQIVVGMGRRAKALLPKQDWKALGNDGIVIKSVGNALVLAGGRPRGSLYAVVQFLEESVGCRFWAPDAKTIPRRSTLSVGPQNVTYVPPFAYREHYATATYVTQPEFATLMRQNGEHQKQPVELGGHYNIIGWCHTYSFLLPPETYFAAHPEWYTDPENGSKPCSATSKMPKGQNTQLCLSNPEVLEELSKRALAEIEKNPAAGYISISQNDSDFHCTCADCDKVFKQEGSQSGPVVKFTNSVAERINAKYPNFWVETLAYRQTVEPPKTIRPKGKVLIRLAPIMADYGHPLNSDWNAKTRDSLLAWAKISPQLFVWNYVVNYNHCLFPFPNWDGLAKDLRFFAANKVEGIFEQGNNYTNGVGDFAPLRAWLLSKLMWNPQLDQTKLRDEYLKGYYGAAGPHLGQYLDMLQQAFTKRKTGILASSRDLSFLGLEEMNQATRLFQKAAAAVQNNPELLERVRREKISIDVVWLVRYRTLRTAATKTGQPFLGPQDGMVALDKFFETAKGFGVKLWGEGSPIESRRTALEAGIAPAAPLPAFARSIPEDDVVDIQDRAFALSAQPVSNFEIDPLASDGKAASTRGDSIEWALQADLNQGISATQPEKWHVYAMVRAALKPGANATGVGLDAGIYDLQNARHVGQRAFPLEEIGLDEYRVVDLGVHAITKYGYVWFAAKLNPAVEKFFVDRVILIRERDVKTGKK